MQSRSFYPFVRLDVYVFPEKIKMSPSSDDRRAYIASGAIGLYALQKFQICVNGAGGMITHHPLYFIDNIDISLFCNRVIFKKAAQVYESGQSLKQTAQIIQIPKSTLRSTLIKGGLSLRPDNRVRSGDEIGVTSYGLVRIDGKLLEDPREQKIIRLMLSHWRSGMSFNGIATLFNRQGLKPRTAKKWDNGTIRKIVLRNKSVKSKGDSI